MSNAIQKNPLQSTMLGGINGGIKLYERNVPPEMKLSATTVKTAKPDSRDYKLFDGGGLFLLVKSNGSKYWRYKYRYRGKEKLLALGVYPTFSLKEAREKHMDARRQLANGIDPGEEKKRIYQETVAKYEDTFEVVAREWWEVNRRGWTEDHAQRVLMSLEKDIFPDIGSKPIQELKTPDMHKVLKKVESRDALDLTSRLLQRCNGVFRYAVQIGKVTRNPCSELSGTFRTRKVAHQPSLPRKDLPEFLQAMDSYDGNPVLLLALKLLVYTFVRPGELRGARWDEFDFEKRLWRIPAERMKMNVEHLVPLSDQVVSLLNELRRHTGRFELLFPGHRDKKKSISENTLNNVIYNLGYKGKATGHGFRATASSILNEEGFNRDAIERQLAHMERNDVRAAYTHHAEYLDDRKKIMQWWSEYLESIF